MSFEIKNKVALVTGSASGIGFSIARELLKNGAKGVALADVNVFGGVSSLEELQEEFGEQRAIFISTDVSNVQNAFEKTIVRFGNIDILVNNAGILDDRIWEKEIDVNIKGTIHGTMLGLETYLQQYRSGSEGVIVNMSSIAGIEAFKEIPIYTATKFAIFGLSKAWGHEMHYKRTNIKILTICPNATSTQMSTRLNEKCLKPEYGNDFLNIIDTLPSQTPDDVAKGVVTIIVNGRPGSGWLIEGGKEPYEIQTTWKEEPAEITRI